MGWTVVDMKKDWKVIYQTHGKVRVLVIAKDFLGWNREGD